MRLVADIRYAINSLLRTPVFGVAAVGSLTLGIATATIVFGLVNAALLRPPPFGDADRLTILNITQRTPAQGEFRLRWSWPQFDWLRRNISGFDDIASSSNAVLTITGDAAPEPVSVEVVSARYLTVMRAPMALGRAFSDAEDQPGTASPVVVLGHDLWRRRFASSDSVLGSTVQMNGVSLTVAGVTGPGFRGVSGLAEAWIPATMAPSASYADYLTTNQHFITVIGRLPPGSNLERARAEMAVLGPRLQAEVPSEADTPDDRFSATVMSLNDARVDVVTKRALLLLAGAVGVLLLIACANVASLLLGRAATRRREIAIRLAVGASRGRLIQQLLLESAVIAGAASLLGITAAAWVMAFVRVPPTLARGRNFYGAVGEFTTPAMDWRVLLFVLAAAAVSVLLAGLTPALQSTRTDVVTDLKAGGIRGARRAGPTLRELAVGTQVALAVVLLVGCGLLLTSYARLRDQPLGMTTDNLLTFMIRPSEVRYPTAAAPALLDRVLGEIEQVPGVQSATVDGCTPLAMQCARAALRIVGRAPSGAEAPLVQRHYVGPAHFITLGIPILRGRGIAPTDRAGTPLVVVINEAAAERFWPGEDPLGRRVWFEGAPVAGVEEASALIVGVVGNVAYQPLDENPVGPDFFTPYAQFTYPTRMVMVRTSGEPLALTRDIARAVERADPALALFDVQSMEQRARLSWSKQSSQTVVFVSIAAIAIMLAVAGVYAVTSYLLTSRLREIGVRMALGAPSRRIVQTALGRTVRIGIGGGVAGLGAAVALSRILQATLFGTSPLEAGAYAGAVGVLLLALAVASYLPVRRALRINPVDVLRGE